MPFLVLWKNIEVALFLVAYIEVKLMGEEKKRDRELCVVISTLVGLRETRCLLHSDFVQKYFSLGALDLSTWFNVNKLP